MDRHEEFHVGDRVMAIRNKSESLRRFYPERGTIGIVTVVCDISDPLLIQWPSGSTSGDDCWTCECDEIQLLPYSEVQMRDCTKLDSYPHDTTLDSYPPDTTEIDLFLSEWRGV